VSEDWKADVCIIGCDTNAHDNLPEMKWLVSGSGAGFEDSFSMCHPDLSKAKNWGYTWDNNNPLTQGNLREPDQRLDYVLFRCLKRTPNSPRLTCTDSRIVLDGPTAQSDHYGILTTFSWQ